MYVTSQFYLKSFFVIPKKSRIGKKCLRSIKKLNDFLCDKKNMNENN